MAISWVRIVLLVVGLLAMLPLTLLFGFYGFVVALIFLLAAAVAK